MGDARSRIVERRHNGVRFGAGAGAFITAIACAIGAWTIVYPRDFNRPSPIFHYACKRLISHANMISKIFYHTLKHIGLH
jgi:hypothetical protein